ncbi:MAG: FGGY-family carbohydrate kinase [Pseudomonadota bacterium]
MSHVAVIDIGKTNAKLALVHRQTQNEIAVVTRPNRVIHAPPWPHFDVDGHWDFLLEGLAAFHASHGIDVISVTTHGACAALIGQDGALAAPILDYEHDGPDALADRYDALRPAFSETGSPRLPMGLNLGAQLHWQFATNPTLLERTQAIVTYPQYWTYLLTGKLACDMSSLGCHTDLWTPYRGRFSSLVDSLGIADKIAPARKPAEILGTLLPSIAVRTGLADTTPVLCGIHDSNASLLPHLLRRTPPFSVVSTGTWVIAMTVGGSEAALDPTRDALINVNAMGQPVPSARYMGGREYEMILGGRSAPFSEPDMIEVARNGPMLLPAVIPDSGPFQGYELGWVGTEPALASPVRGVAAGFYLAMMTSECLGVTAHQGPIIVEGPMATNPSFCAMLANATGSPVHASKGITGTSQGAALLVGAENNPVDRTATRLFTPESNGPLKPYADRWRKNVRLMR